MVAVKFPGSLKEQRRDAQIDFGCRLAEILDDVEKRRLIKFLRRTDGDMHAFAFPTEPAIIAIVDKINRDWQARYLLNRIYELFGVPQYGQPRP